MPIAVARATGTFALVFAASIVAHPASADEPLPDVVANTVKLDLQISGLDEGWTVKVKPAHPGSRFKTVVRRIKADENGPGRLGVLAIPAESLSADRACAFAIVLTDPSGTAKTFKRSVRLLPQDDPEAVPELSKTFYLRTSAVASKDEPERRPK